MLSVILALWIGAVPIQKLNRPSIQSYYRSLVSQGVRPTDAVNRTAVRFGARPDDVRKILEQPATGPTQANRPGPGADKKMKSLNPTPKAATTPTPVVKSPPGAKKTGPAHVAFVVELDSGKGMTVYRAVCEFPDKSTLTAQSTLEHSPGSEPSEAVVNFRTNRVLRGGDVQQGPPLGLTFKADNDMVAPRRPDVAGSSSGILSQEVMRKLSTAGSLVAKTPSRGDVTLPRDYVRALAVLSQVIESDSFRQKVDEAGPQSDGRRHFDGRELATLVALLPTEKKTALEKRVGRAGGERLPATPPLPLKQP